MKGKNKVSAVQMKILSGKVNLPKILYYIDKCSMSGSNIICFPEGVFNFNPKKPAQEKDLVIIQNACQKNNTFAVINGYFKNSHNKVSNQTYLIDNHDSILGHYDKIYLWVSQINVIIKRERTVKVIDTSLGKIGLCTCWDLFFPEIFKNLKGQGAEIIFCPSYWSDRLKKESKFLEYVPTTTAYQQMVFFVYCNALFKGKTSITQITAP